MTGKKFGKKELGGAARDASDRGGEEREALCRRCGVCCHEKVRFGARAVITDIPCEFLDAATNNCTVYPERFARQPRCSSAADSVIAGALPGDCPYVGGVDGYLEPHLLSEHPEYGPVIAELFPGRRAAGASPRAAVFKRRRGRK